MTDEQSKKAFKIAMALRPRLDVVSVNDSEVSDRLTQTPFYTLKEANDFIHENDIENAVITTRINGEHHLVTHQDEDSITVEKLVV